MDQIVEGKHVDLQELSPEEREQAKLNIIRFAQQNNYHFEVDKTCVMIMIPSFKVKE